MNNIEVNLFCQCCCDSEVILIRLFCSCSVSCSCELAGLGCWVAMGGWLLCWCLVGTTQGLGSVVVYYVLGYGCGLLVRMVDSFCSLY